MNYSGSSSVQLPTDAISDYEIFDEPGVASYIRESGATIGVDMTAIASRTISVPASGYVMVLGSCQLEVYHSSGTTTDADIGVSDSDSYLPVNQRLRFEIPSACTSGWYNHPVTCHGLFEVTSAGDHTFYMNAERASGSIYASEMQLTLLYVPTAYGTIDPTIPAVEPPSSDPRGATRSGLTKAEIAAERAESQAVNLARIERELAELQAQVETMKEQ
jgi:hypothetical protein